VMILTMRFVRGGFMEVIQMANPWIKALLSKGLSRKDVSSSHPKET